MSKTTEEIVLEQTSSGKILQHIAAGVHLANSKWWLDLTKPCRCRMPIYRNTDVAANCPLCNNAGYEKKQRNVGELLMLVTSELSEALEGHRKNLKDDHLPNYDMFTVEIADAMIRLFDLIGGLCPQFSGAFDDKMAYNRTRADHSIEERLKANGKKI